MDFSWNENSVMCVAIDPRGRTPQFHVDKWQLLFKGGFYSRAASIRGRLLFKKIRYWITQFRKDSSARVLRKLRKSSVGFLEIMESISPYTLKITNFK